MYYTGLWALFSRWLQQNQRSMHNNNSCSCILIQSGGLSFIVFIFLHSCNYDLAKETGLEIRVCGVATSHSLFTCLKARYSNCTVIMCICLVPSTGVASQSSVCKEQSASVPTLTSSQVVLRKAIFYHHPAASHG